MTHVGIFDEIALSVATKHFKKKIRKLKKELKDIQQDKNRGHNDLERIIEEQRKEIDTLKTEIDIKELDYFYSNSISRASKTMSECRQIKQKLKKTGTNNL